MTRWRWLFLMTCSCCAIALGSQQQSGVEQLIQAAKDGDLQQVHDLLAAGVPVDATQTKGDLTALAYAADRAQYEVIRALVEAGADVNAADLSGSIPLHDAAARDSVEAVRFLIESGSNVNAESLQMNTPLATAASSGRLENARALLEAGADPNLGRWMPPLSAAVRQKRGAMIELLMEHGANVNAGDPPPIHWAGSREMAEALVRHGADPNARNKQGASALHLTTGAWIPDADAVGALIHAGADVNARDNRGATPLMAALRQKQAEIVRVLLDAGADVSAVDSGGNTVLSLAQGAGDPMLRWVVEAGATNDGLPDLLRAAEEGDEARVREILLGGADADITGPESKTAAHIASGRGDAGILMLLVEHGANLDAMDAKGFTPLHLATNAVAAEALLRGGAKTGSSAPGEPSPLYCAIAYNHTDVAEALLAHGVDLDNESSPGALCWAAFFGRTAIVKTLLQHDANPNGMTDDAFAMFSGTPITIAAGGFLADMRSPDGVTVQDRVDIIRLLLESGADVNRTTTVGFSRDFTALHAAARAGDLPIVEILIDHGADVNAAANDTYQNTKKSPLDIARDPEVRAMLESRGGRALADPGED